MSDIAPHLGVPKLAAAMEPNNNSDGLNLDYQRPRNDSLVSMSSVSSTSDTSEDGETFGEDKREERCNEEHDENMDIRKIFRSLSDGQAGKVLNQDVFPSLPNRFLTKLGLYGDAPRERMSEEELEQKFVSLALAFTIDAATIKSRCERQRRYRDQTEANLIAEIEKLIEKVTHIQPLCVDAETAELLAGLLTQIDVVVKACSHAATSAERFGAVQHEERLAEAVSLMISHVTLLKQQRDSTRKQLQYTKRVLQDTNSSESPSPKPRLSLPTNGKIITKRRASIASIAQPQDPNQVAADSRRVTRRISDLTTRVSALARSSRPSRLELGVDLDKIKEGIVENGTTPHDPVYDSYSEQSDVDVVEVKPRYVDTSQLTLPEKIAYKCKRLSNSFLHKYEKSNEDGTLHELFYFGALLCFALGLVVLVNLLVELEYSRRYDGHDSLNVFKETIRKNSIET